MGRIFKSCRKNIFGRPYESESEEIRLKKYILLVRLVMKYRHCDGKLVIKVTDDHVCLQYLTEHAQDVKKVEKLSNQLMRHMASKEK
ncbi:signal recognition particle 9 kDa protein-like isoform X1 [Tachypleus tridentatus]|uniref:signal recognition particle 9 kDa protein-like isoform X1 n=1 Tax=Tachypleus tridentatus TaxID=6853 RepID=UPI003FD02598